MVAIPFPISTSPGQKPQEGAGRLVNVFAEPRGEGLGPVWHRAPGSITFATTANSNFRGGLQVGTTLFAAWTNTIKTVTSGGVVSNLDTLTGTDKIFIARNNNATPQVVIVCNDGPFIYDPLGPDLDSYPDADIGSPTCVCCHLGFFIFGYANGDLQASDLNDTNINTLNRARAESNPDGVSRVESYNGQIYAFGTSTIEIWGDPINTSGFPFNRVGYNFTPGLIAPHAISGFQPEFGYSPIYVGQDNTVRQINGFTADKISSPDLDRLIAAVTDKDTLEASCYLANGFAFWQLSCPAWTWTFCLNNGKWHERTSYLLERSRFTGTVFAFDKWLTGDTEGGNILQVLGSAVTESGQYVIARLESGPVKDFPNRIRVPRVDFDFTVGVGIATGTEPIETDPSVSISWSDDGGDSWSVPKERKLGRQAMTQQRITMINTGMSGPMGRRWRLDVSDPVHVGFLGGDMSAELRAK